MRQQLKALLEARVPFLLDGYRAVKNRLLFRKRFAALHRAVRRELYGKGRITVLAGPFKGLRYFDEVVWGPITPKWLGSYEAELASVVEEIATRGYRVVLDVGCAEGYYAVGLATRLPQAHIHAYDTDFISRRQARRLAHLNHVEERVRVSGFCSAAELAKRGSGGALLVCDIEGYERSFLCPATSPALLGLDILVEVHEDGANAPSTLEVLKERFSTTHEITELHAQSREEWFATLPQLRSDLLRDAANEHRYNGLTWLWMKRRTS